MYFQSPDGRKVLIDKNQILDALLNRPKNTFKAKPKLGNRNRTKAIIKRSKVPMNKTDILKYSPKVSFYSKHDIESAKIILKNPRTLDLIELITI